MSACLEVRRLMPKCDILYLADRKNAPYGTKAPDELSALVKRDVKRLRDFGVSEILVACCTASTVAHTLSDEEQRGVLPIISPAAKVAARLGRITVIATEHTVRSSAFGREIRRLSPYARVQEIPCQRLVALVEEGSRDGNVAMECEEILAEVARAAKEHSSEGIILGCTHFSHLENTIKALLPRVEIINPARLGAEALVRLVKDVTGTGRIIYTE